MLDQLEITLFSVSGGSRVVTYKPGTEYETLKFHIIGDTGGAGLRPKVSDSSSIDDISDTFGTPEYVRIRINNYRPDSYEAMKDGQRRGFVVYKSNLEGSDKLYPPIFDDKGPYGYDLMPYNKLSMALDDAIKMASEMV